MLSFDQVQEFDRDGFVLVPGVFSPDEVALLLEHSRGERVASSASGMNDAQGRASKLALWVNIEDDVWGAVSSHPRIVNSVRALLREEVYHWHSKVMLKEPRVGGAWEWHQDYGYWYGDGCLYPRLISCLIALDGATRANGCLKVLPGSHLLGRIDHGQAGGQAGSDPERLRAIEEVLPVHYVEAPPGSALFFHCNLLHASDPNTSERARTSYICCYNAFSNAPYGGQGHGQPEPIRPVSEDAILHFGTLLRRDETLEHQEHTMILGFLGSSVDDIAKAGALGFRGLELGAGALGSMNEPVAPSVIEEVKALCAMHNVQITALAFYDLAWNEAVRADPLPFYCNVIALGRALDVEVVASMAGFDSSLGWQGNLDLFSKRFAPVCQHAGECGVRLALENWMALYGPPPQKPGNFGGGPAIWDALFEAVPADNLGIEFDPSHLFGQGIDHIRALQDYAGKVFHVHAKDTEMLPEERYRWGAYACPFRFRIPGYGDINWTRFVATLDEIGYTGGVAIEHEDPIYGGERFDEGLRRGHHVLNPLLHP